MGTLTRIQLNPKYSQIENITTLDDLRKYVGYMRTMKFVLHVSKLWASKQAANGQDTRKYGLTMKVRRVVVMLSSNQTEEEEVDDLNKT